MSKLKLTEITVFIDESLEQLNNINRNFKRGNLHSEIIIDADEKKSLAYIRAKLIEVKETSDTIADKLKL